MRSVPLQRLSRDRRHQDLIECQPFYGRAGDCQVARVRRIERATKKSNAHRASYRARGLYSVATRWRLLTLRLAPTWGIAGKTSPQLLIFCKRPGAAWGALLSTKRTRSAF